MTARLARLLVALFLAAAASAGGAAAHVTELAVLRVTELSDTAFTVSWELRPNLDNTSDLEPIFPEGCVYDPPQLTCENGLVGRLGFERIGAGQSAAMFKIRRRNGATDVFTLTPVEPTVDVARAFDGASAAGVAQIVRSYIQIGFEHILVGIDHLMFVAGLMWISRTRWMLLKTITAFTVAHSLTLAAVTFGWVGVPENFVNAMIALSIVFIGVEILNARADRSTLTLRHPWGVSFFFGLLHGFGFANALVNLGLPEGAAPWALVAFNIGEQEWDILGCAGAGPTLS